MRQVSILCMLFARWAVANLYKCLVKTSHINSRTPVLQKLANLLGSLTISSSSYSLTYCMQLLCHVTHMMYQCVPYSF